MISVTGKSPSQFSLSLLFAVITWLIVTSGLIGWVAPTIGFASIGTLMFPALFVCSYLALLAIICAWMKELSSRIGFGLVGFIFVFFYFLIAIQLIIAVRMANPSPRPMFHNHFGRHELSLLPDWRRPNYYADDSANRYFLDLEDNVIAIFLRDPQDESFEVSIRAGLQKTDFALTTSTSETSFRLDRTKNLVVVVSANGSAARYGFGANNAYYFDRYYHSRRRKSYLSGIAKLLIEEDRQRFERQFIN